MTAVADSGLTEGRAVAIIMRRFSPSPKSEGLTSIFLSAAVKLAVASRHAASSNSITLVRGAIFLEVEGLETVMRLVPADTKNCCQ